MADLTFEKISSYFHLPINEASRELKVCATILKKVCRASGISRWPHRKIRSLENMINQLKSQLDMTINEQERQRIQTEIFSFEEKKDFITRNPNTSYKSIVPKSTLQSFSKSKTKNGSKFVVTPKSEEEVLEVLTRLSQVDVNNSDLVNNHANGEPKRFFLPLKKEILKIEREKEKLKLLSQPNFTLQSPFEDYYQNNQNNNVITHQSTATVNEGDEITTTSKLSIESLVNVVNNPIEKENSGSANIQIINFDHNNKESKGKRKFDEFAEQIESLDEFRKFKSSFPSLKYHRIWENDCSLVYISNHTN